MICSDRLERGAGNMAFSYRVQKIKYKEENSLHQKGSLTVESAFVLPLFFLAAVIIAGILDLFCTTVKIQHSLCEGAKELGMYAYCSLETDSSPVGIVNNGVCAVYGSKKIRDELKGENLPGIVGGINGITLMESNYKDEIISLKAIFFYRIPVVFFQAVPVKIKVLGQARAWKGYEGEVYGTEEEEEMVYVTQWESVYHESEACTYLKLSIHEVASASIEEARNIYGERYHSCEKCVGNGSMREYVYVTQTGNRYHNSAECGGLIRHVKLVKKSEAAHLQACSRCGGESE